jgi:hypothetical protein
MNKYRITICLLVCAFLFGCAAKREVPLEEVPPPSNLPIAKEGTIIDYTNPAEILVEAAGIGPNTDAAILDARRSAIYVVLLGGSDPLLQTQEERSKFELIQEDFYSQANIANFIPWESREIESRLTIEGGKVKVTKHFKVNKRMMSEELERRGIIKPPPPLPTIMVIPEVPKGQDPVDAMSEDVTLKHAAQVIESYLTNRRYNVQVPEQKVTIDGLVEAQQAFKGMEDDYSYQLALSIGSDVYITFTLDMQTRNVGGSTVRKAIVGVRAYETTTARLLGTETGYSEELPAADLVVIEEAVHGAIDKVLSRINAYWKQDLEQGVQYKLVVSIQGDFDSDEREDIAFAIDRVIKQNCKFAKLNIKTEKTLDYLVWVDPEQITDSTDLYGALRRDFPMEFQQGQLRSINITGKLILLRVTEKGG